MNTKGKFLHEKIYKKKSPHQYKKNVFVFSINMSNTQQNNIRNEIEQINKEINLLQDRLKKNEKSLNQFQNGLMQIKRMQIKKGQRTHLSQTKEIQNIVKDILQNKIKQIEKNANLLQNILTHVKERKRLFEKGLKKIAKMQNFS